MEKKIKLVIAKEGLIFVPIFAIAVYAAALEETGFGIFIISTYAIIRFIFWAIKIFLQEKMKTLIEKYPLASGHSVSQTQISKDEVFLITEDGKKQNLTLKDFSEAGACVCSNYPFKKDEFFPITIEAKGIINKRARVVWSKQVNPNSWEAGLDFMNHAQEA